MNKIILIIYFFLLNSILSYTLPNWVSFELAKAEYQNGNFSKSLDYFFNITKRDYPYPEAEYMIGLIYLEEGELELAREQVEKAINNSSYLEVYPDLLEYKFTLAKIYLLMNDLKKYEEALKDIADNNITSKDIEDYNSYYDVLIKSGMDRVIHLYRRDMQNTINANIYLGLYYNYMGEYKKSINYLLPPIISFISQVIDDNKQFNREYEYTSLSVFFTDLSKNKRALEYLNQNDFFRIYYYLGQSILGLGETDKSLELWKSFSQSGIESRWITIAKNQIIEPNIDKLKELY